MDGLYAARGQESEAAHVQGWTVYRERTRLQEGRRYDARDGGGRLLPGARTESRVGDLQGRRKVEQRQEQLPGTVAEESRAANVQGWTVCRGSAGDRQGWRRYDARDGGGRVLPGARTESSAGSGCREQRPRSPKRRVSREGLHAGRYGLLLFRDTSPFRLRSSSAEKPRASVRACPFGAPRLTLMDRGGARNGVCRHKRERVASSFPNRSLRLQNGQGAEGSQIGIPMNAYHGAMTRIP